MPRKNLLAAPLCALLAVASPSLLHAQDARPVAFTNARILTMHGAPIERGTLVTRNGRIVAVSADAVAPAGAIVVDCAGGTLMPGLVSAFSRAGLVRDRQPITDAEPRRNRRQRGGMPDVMPNRSSGNRAATKIVEALDPKQDVFARLLAAGVTTLSLVPQGTGLPGLGALLRPDGKTLDALTLDDDAFVFVGMARESSTKKTLKEAFEQAKKVVEARKQPKPEPKPESAPPAGEQKPDAKPGEQKPADKPAEPKKDEKPAEPKPQEPKPPEPKPQDGKPAEKPAEAKPPEAKEPEKKDPNLEVLADLLEGKRRAILEITSAADLLHWFHACGEDLKFPRAIATLRHDQQAGSFDLVIDQLKKFDAPVLMPPDLSVVQRTRYLVNPAQKLHQAGIEVGFVLGDTQPAVRSLFYRLMELVRAGLPADVALRGVTAVPSKVLGIDGDVGTLETGKRANLLLWSGDPLDPTSELRSVWLEGKKVETSL